MSNPSPKKRPYNGKGDPRCLGDAGLRPDQVVSQAQYQALGKRFQKLRPRAKGWRSRGRNAMRVRGYWYQQDQDGKLIPIREMTRPRVVSEIEFADRESGWIRGWCSWGGKWVEVRKYLGEKVWKILLLADDGNTNSEEEDIHGGTRHYRGRPIAWPPPIAEAIGMESESGDPATGSGHGPKQG